MQTIPIDRAKWAALLGLCASAAVAAHEGPLDSYGCHTNLAHRIYHCHTGPAAGEQFKSRAHMVRALKEKERDKRKKPTIEVRTY